MRVTPLPIDETLPEIVARVREARSLVLVAEPGAGKTTRVPPAILRAGLLDAAHPNLVMLQPRRVAARASAEWIAQENGWTLGEEVGYHVRFDRRLGPKTRLRVVTEGILTRQLLDDPFLEGVGGVILDEFHERSINTDLAIALLREVRQTVRDDLILLVMSATLDAEPVARFLDGCPVLNVPGRTFPVEVVYRGTPMGAARPATPDAAAAAVIDALAGDAERRDVLVFLPGADEIRRTAQRLETAAGRDDLLVLPLHGSLPAAEQDRALRPANRRKVILATNIAETSLTIEGVGTVIDTGLARIAGFDPSRGLDRLELSQISKASARQRAGRAGRTGPGRCYRLWTQREESAMPDFETPEIRRVDLAATVLALHAWGRNDPRAFGWYEPPLEPTLLAAESLLEMLGAIEDGRITDLGRRISTLPLHPRLGRLMLAAAEAGLVEQGAAMAALLSEKDVLQIDASVPYRQRGPETLGESDLLVRLEMLARAEKANFTAYLRDESIDPQAARQVARIRDELVRLGRRLPGKSRHGGEDALLRLPLYAYPDRVVRRRTKDPSAGAMVGGSGVRLAPESVVRHPEFFLALDARHDPRSPSREAVVRIASGIDADWLDEMFPRQVRRERTTIYDPARDRVVARGSVFYRDLLLREDADAPVDPAAAAGALADAIRANANDIVNGDEPARQWLARLALLRASVPEHPWPAMTPHDLADLLATLAPGKRSLAEIRRQPIAAVFASTLTYPLDRLFDQLAPESLQVPSGSRIKLDYLAGERPVLAVRLQEVFGWTQTPRVAGGRVAVVLHLLGPNYRPVQITDDLGSFWATTYFQVRKDLRVRYPKHAWPEDPLTAAPQAKGRPRQ